MLAHFGTIIFMVLALAVLDLGKKRRLCAPDGRMAWARSSAVVRGAR
jgi:hypothetical protein